MKKKIVTMVIFATLTAGCSNKAELYNIKIDVAPQKVKWQRVGFDGWFT